MTAAKTILPVVGVPVIATPLRGLDAFLSIMQMPAEVGVATVAVGPTGARNAALFAVAALASTVPSLRKKLRSPHGAPPDGAVAAQAPGSVVILAQDEADLQALHPAEQYLTKLGVAHQKLALNTDPAALPLANCLADLEAQGAAVFIAGCRGGIAFGRAVASATTLPVLGVPLVGEPITCVDDFLQPFLDMSPGLATFAIDRPGAINAALFAATVISPHESEVWTKLHQMRDAQVKRVRAMKV